jgi:hypothetical protein
MGQMKDTYFWGYYPEKTYDYTPAHTCTFPDTGLAKSWCNCGKEGLYNFQLGKYIPTTNGDK